MTRSNDAYAWNGLTNRNDSATVNGLNQMTAQGAVSLTHDTRGNVTGVGASAYSYTSDNMLKTGPAGTSLAYDPLGRLQSVTQGSNVTRFGYDGSDLVTERDGSNTLTRRYVHGPGTDAPIVWYEGAGTTDRRFLHADERGSIVAVTNGAGAMVGTNHYDDYGVPAATNIGRFQYTGQTWMPELGLYNYKARFYDPKLGRFMQTDPIGYGDGMNLYAYVGGDPVNMLDPSGTSMLSKWMWSCYGNCEGGGYWNTGIGGLNGNATNPYGFELTLPDEAPRPATNSEVRYWIERLGGWFEGYGDNMHFVWANNYAFTFASTQDINRSGLYRAVDDLELAAMAANGMRFVPSPSGLEVKYFWPNPTFAFVFGKEYIRQGWVKTPVHIVYSPKPQYFQYSTVTISDLAQYGLGRIYAITVPNSELYKIQPAIVIGYIPLK